MKKFILGTLGILTLFLSSCKDDNDDNEGDLIDPASLVTPEVTARVVDPLTTNSFTGILEIFPCNSGSSIYYGNFVNDNTLTVYIKRLREKIEDDPQNPRLIRTVRGLGYRVD